MAKSSDWKHLQFNVFYACFNNVFFIKVKKHVICFLFANQCFNIYADTIANPL